MTLDELFERHHKSLFRFVSRMTSDPDFAKDIVQETFLTIAREGRSEPPSRAWLFQLARNLARSGMRKRDRRLRLLRGGSHRVPGPAPTTLPDVEAERAEARAAVRGALERLSEKERTIVLMREEGFTHREIADAVGTTTGSVGTMFARALGKLEERLGETSGDES
jgi:RNA polymerase sigma factor (sigma-70 family)